MYAHPAPYIIIGSNSARGHFGYAFVRGCQAPSTRRLCLPTRHRAIESRDLYLLQICILAVVPICVRVSAKRGKKKYDPFDEPPTRRRAIYDGSRGTRNNKIPLAHWHADKSFPCIRKTRENPKEKGSFFYLQHTSRNACVYTVSVYNLNMYVVCSCYLPVIRRTRVYDCFSTSHLRKNTMQNSRAATIRPYTQQSVCVFNILTLFYKGVGTQYAYVFLSCVIEILFAILYYLGSVKKLFD